MPDQDPPGYDLPLVERGTEIDDESTDSDESGSPNGRKTSIDDLAPEKDEGKSSASALKDAKGVISSFAPLFVVIHFIFMRDKPVIDGFVFRLHYRFTFSLILVCWGLLLAEDLVGKFHLICFAFEGNPVKPCHKDLNHARAVYCWVTSTFTAHAPEFDGKVGVHNAYPGISHLPGKTITRQLYYQWVQYILMAQAVFFYLPHLIWKALENKNIDKITKETRGFTLKTVERKVYAEKLTDFLKETFHNYRFYVGYYLCAELLNLVNLLVQVAVLDGFLGGVPLRYGFEVFSWMSTVDEMRTDQLIRIFPRMGKCTFHQYGASGTIVNEDLLCILPQNVVNEKIFVSLWIWFVILALCTALYLLCVMAAIFIPTIRRFIVEKTFEFENRKVLNTLVKEAELGDWLLIYLLSKNMDKHTFQESMAKFTRNLKSGK